MLPNLHEEDQLAERLWFLRRPAQLALDMAVLCGAFLLAYLPAVNVQLGDFYFEAALSQLPFVVLVEFAALFSVGAYSIIWRYISIEDLRVFLKAAVISAIIFLSLRFLLIYSPF